MSTRLIFWCILIVELIAISALSVVVPFKLGTTFFTGTVEFYGDSITSGLGVSTAQRYSNLLATQYGFTPLNIASAAATIQDMLIQVYNNHVPGNLAVVMIGYDDVADSVYTDSNFYQFKESFMGQLLYMMLNSTQLLSNRGLSVTGTWSSTSALFTNGGSYTQSNGGTVKANVTGRYIGYFLTLSVSNTATFTVSVDGGPAVSVTAPASPTSPAGGANNMIPWFYDTGTSANHTIFLTNGASSTLDVEFFFAFDNLSGLGNSAVVVIGNSPSTFASGSGTLSRQKLINEVQQQVVTFLRQEYGAKITFVNEIPYWAWGNKNSDMITPDVHGHLRIRDTVNSVLNNGELISFV